MNKFSCIILAGGLGNRFGYKKQFIKWHEKEIWKYPYETATQVSDDVVVVGVDIPRGNTRQESVLNGLKKIKYDRVVILEAVRPLVTKDQIDFIANIDYPSISYAIKSTDTIIYKNKVLDRKHTYRLQVPQAFDRDMLLNAHRNTKYKNATDDTSLMEEYYGIKPKLIKGGTNLKKITYPEDLEILEVIKSKL